MAHRNDNPEDWELRPFSSDRLKKSSSVEILLGTHPTARGRMLASFPNASTGKVTSHKMKGSGRPTRNGKADTLPSSVVSHAAPSTAAPTRQVPNGGVSKAPQKESKSAKDKGSRNSEGKSAQLIPKDTDTKTAQEKSSNDTESRNAQADSKCAPGELVHGKEKPVVPLSVMNPDLLGSNSSLRRMSETPLPAHHPGYNTPMRRESETPVPPHPLAAIPLALLGSNSSLRRFSETPVAPYHLTSTPVQTTKPQTSQGAPGTPPMSTLRTFMDKASHLPPLVTSNKPEYNQSPMSTPRGTPKGTPIIGKRGHVFSVSTPEVEPETGQPPPLVPADFRRKKRTVQECVGDPFVQRRKTKSMTDDSEDKDKEDTAGGGDGDEPVWQRRLSLLFIPPTENELEKQKAPEETTRLIPRNITPHILRKQSIDSLSYTPPRSRKKDREERAARRKEREEKKEREREEKEREEREREKKEREERELKEREERERATKRKEREEKERIKRKKEEEDRLKPARIIFEEEGRGKSEEKKKKKNTTKFSRLRTSSISDDPASSSSSHGTSEEEEEEELANEREPGDDYTSWDDTICSNRSSYFKKYYSQRGVIGRSADEKDGSLRSPFDASHNSLSSLIREKMGKPSKGSGKKGVQVGLVVLVVVLLVIIVAGISLTTYFYNLHLLELFIFNRIKFYETPRILEIYDLRWQPLITAQLGSNLPDNSIPEDCTQYLHYLESKNYTLPHHGLDDDDYEDMVCLDWTGLAQLHLRKLYASGSVQCYSVWWMALKEDFMLRDCLKADVSHGVWWGGGEMSSGGFPITRADVPPEKMETGKLERDPWGQVLRRAWLSDHASLLFLPASFRGRVSVNHELNEQVCLEVPPDPCSHKNRVLSYTMCIAPNLTTLGAYMHQHTVRERHVVGRTMPTFVNYSTEMEEHDDGETYEVTLLREHFRPEVVTRVEERLENPVWIPWMSPDSPELTQEAVLQYVERMLTNKTLGVWGLVLLPATWQTRPGEMEFDPERFPDPLALSTELQTKGFRLAVTLHPFVSVDAPAFNTGTKEGLWVRQKNSVLPALASYDERFPSVVTDFSNPRARKWYAAQLRRLKEKYKIDRFHLQPADAHALPAFHDHHLQVQSPDATLVPFMASVSSVSPPVSTEGTVTPPMPPTFVSLGTGDGAWGALETLVPRVLTLAMLGFPFVDVGPIGGLARAGHVPERELYIRWLEVAAFLPAMQISVLPSTYGEEVEELAREYFEKRKQLVLPRLLERVKEGLEHGKPLITPLSSFVPDDPEAATVDDEWMLGNDLLVAPVTRRGERTRTFYLPKGIWKDEIDGHLRSGGRWVKNYKVPLTKIPHFTLKYIDDFET